VCCVLRGAWCVVRGAWCVVCIAWCVHIACCVCERVKDTGSGRVRFTDLRKKANAKNQSHLHLTKKSLTPSRL
jgi:hypothetical protein